MEPDTGRVSATAVPSASPGSARFSRASHAGLVMCVGVALEAAVARWLPAGSSLDGVVQGIVLLTTSGSVAVMAARGKRARVALSLGLLAFLVAALVLFIVSVALECRVRPSGCDV